MTFDLPESADGNVDIELQSIRPTLTTEEYDAATIRAEFRTYQSVLPKPDELLQQQHSAEVLRNLISNKGTKIPRWLTPKEEGGIAPHDALCSLLLKEIHAKGGNSVPLSWWFVRILSLGAFYPSINLPADIIREQFHSVAHVMPTEVVTPCVLRRTIRHRGLPVPNFFLDPEDGKQFPPHIAMLVILQDGEKESKHMANIFYRFVWWSFAVGALVLRFFLEVVGGAGAIWGGSEVIGLRVADNKELWRWISVTIGILCYLRFVTLNAPRKEDEGDILGPAGPWSLRPSIRLRAVVDHPFHYLFRAQPPYMQQTINKTKDT